MIEHRKRVTYYHLWVWWAIHFKSPETRTL